LRSSYLRQENKNGIGKRTPGLRNAVFWAEKLKEAGQQISDSFAKLLPISYHQVFFLRTIMDVNEFQRIVGRYNRGLNILCTRRNIKTEDSPGL
jgi:hypothetical protein